MMMQTKVITHFPSKVMTKNEFGDCLYDCLTTQHLQALAIWDGSSAYGNRSKADSFFQVKS